MMINVQAYPIEIMELLFLQAAWSLPTRVSKHNLDPAPDTGSSRPPEDNVAELAEAWDAYWEASWDHHPAELPLDGARIPSRWLAEKGARGIDVDAMNTWIWSVKLTAHEHARREPERQVLNELVGAWKRGLQSIIVLPLASDFTEWRGRNLVVSTQTRLGPGRYAEALQSGPESPS